MTSIDWTDVSTGLCESVASYFEGTFTSKGVTVWLRFAHEMNYYADSGTYPGGSKLVQLSIVETSQEACWLLMI
jgi:hypothetical protein